MVPSVLLREAVAVWNPLQTLPRGGGDSHLERQHPLNGVCGLPSLAEVTQTLEHERGRLGHLTGTNVVYTLMQAQATGDRPHFDDHEDAIVYLSVPGRSLLEIPCKHFRAVDVRSASKYALVFPLLRTPPFSPVFSLISLSKTT